jgi:hypothetical protein
MQKALVIPWCCLDRFVVIAMAGSDDALCLPELALWVDRSADLALNRVSRLRVVTWPTQADRSVGDLATLECPAAQRLLATSRQSRRSLSSQASFHQQHHIEAGGTEDPSQWRHSCVSIFDAGHDQHVPAKS